MNIKWYTLYLHVNFSLPYSRFQIESTKAIRSLKIAEYVRIFLTFMPTLVNNRGKFIKFNLTKPANVLNDEMYKNV